MERSSRATTGLVPARGLFLGQAAAVLLVTVAGLAAAAALWSGPPDPAYIVLGGVAGAGLGAGVGAISSRKLARRTWQSAGAGPPRFQASRCPTRVPLETGIWFAVVYAALVGAGLLAHFRGTFTLLVLAVALAVTGGQQLGLFWWTAQEERTSGGQLLVLLKRGRLGRWGIDLLLVVGAPRRGMAPGYPGLAG